MRRIQKQIVNYCHLKKFQGHLMSKHFQELAEFQKIGILFHS